MEQNIQNLLNERYYLPEERSWSQLAKRISAIFPPSYDDINNKTFIPSSPTLMNANTGGKRKGTLSSCFTMGIEDSIEGIFDALKEGALVTKASGGVGYVFSRLRSSYENIKSLERQSSGPLPFAASFNTMLDGIQQGGVRRGAGMAQFNVNHPNILDFIREKSKKGVMERLNFSVRMTDEFYFKLKNSPDSPHMVCTQKGEWFPLLDNGKPVTTQMLWDEIIEYAWLCAEPGIFNIDIATRQCTVTNIGEYVLSNPCAEYVSIPYSSCNLGSLNLVNFVINGEFDFDAYEKAIRTATRFLNNVIDINNYPLLKIEEVTKQVRPIGLGAMGYAHMLYLLGIPFNSPEADSITDVIFNKLTLISMDESCEIAKEEGKSYPAYDYDLFMKANSRFFNDSRMSLTNVLKEKIKKYGIANSCFTSIAPNGSISYLANTTGGIEPVFALTYARKIEKLNREYETVYISDPIFDKYLTDTFDEKTKVKILKQVSDNKGSCQNVLEMSEKDRAIFVVASDLTPMEHLNSLGIVARNTSLSVSKTINLPSTATREEISDVYLKAHDLGVIGVTVYRDGCRDGILVHSNTKDKGDSIIKTNAPKRPKSLPCNVFRVSIINRHTNAGEKWIVFIGLLNDDPYEIIAGKIEAVDFDTSITEGEMVKSKKDGKKVYQFVHNGEVLVDDISSAYVNDLREYVTRLMSLALRHGASIEYLKSVLQKSNGSIVDFDKAIIRSINKYCKQVNQKEKCPVCNSDLLYTEGCIKCSSLDCSWTKCA
jgi:ribonucleoside-diphosphate reductase alpha chain